MQKTDFRLWNNILGWSAFLIAFLTYYLTMEPSVSWWDCGEFSAAASKLEVPHPPGAPLFMLIARVFASLAGEPGGMAKMMNLVSVLSSALTILFLFWTITHLARKIMGYNKKYQLSEMIFIFGAGLVGAMTYTFSDSFWFSAVESEVYAMSSLFTAVVFWAMLRWEAESDQPHHLRWIVLIAFLMGLSIGVHLLNLLAIPAMFFIYYFKKFPLSMKGAFFAFCLSALCLVMLMYVVIPGLPLLASWFELFFVNLIGLPYTSGIIAFSIILLSFIIWGLIETKKRNLPIWNTIILSFAVMLIGYGSYATLVVRSNANPPMDQNNPDMVFRLLKYINREQYGDNPLLYGPYYNAPVVEAKDTKPTYSMIDKKYKITDQAQKRVYDARFETIFPRMWHNSPDHIQAYQAWGEVKGVPVSVRGQDGQPQKLMKPTFGENLRYFFSYQLGHMYFRYFMWNFVGRQNDEQGQGGISDGNWISGINFIDAARLGPLDRLPEHAKTDPSRNVYFFLPFLLGILGAVHQYRKGKNDFWIVALLFFYTGIAIVLYLNQWPNQPRERDYSFVGSFYAFAIWVGLGVLAFSKSFGKDRDGSKRGRILASPVWSFVITLLLLAVPALMAFENWEDHDRSDRYIARDYASNYLNSCAPNAILFTNGDNDTFPLWYAQEVEGIRTDVRVVCLPYLAADWYIDQLKRKVYDSDPLPISLKPEQYRMGVRDYIPVQNRLEDQVDLKAAMQFVLSEEQGSKLPAGNDLFFDYLPANKFYLKVDKEKVLNNGTVPQKDAALILDTITWEINRRSIYKNDLIILDILAQNNWDRPIYFTSIMHQNINGLGDFFRLEGFAYRLVPIKNNPDESHFNASINTDILYDNYINKFKWGNIEKENTWIDFYTQRTSMILKIRYHFSQLADHLMAEGHPDKAEEVLDRVVELMPPSKFPHDVFSIAVADSYFNCGQNEKGKGIILEYLDIVIEDLSYYLSLQQKLGNTMGDESQRNLQILNEMVTVAKTYGEEELSKTIETRVQTLASEFGG